MHSRRVFTCHALLWIVVLSSALVSGTAASAQSRPVNLGQVDQIRVGTHPTHTRIVFDLSDSIDVQQNFVKGPDRILINFTNARLASNLPPMGYDVGDGIVQKIAFHSVSSVTVSVEIFLERMTHYNAQGIPNPHRYVVDVYGNRTRSARLSPSTHVGATSPDAVAVLPPASKELQGVPMRGLFQTIVIDAGHGGKDPGAIGRSGLREKDVVLDIAKRLESLLIKKLRKNVIMTRRTDVFIPLNRRTQIANENQADLFVSIHANASPRRSTSGIEIYLFGEASDRRAAETAARENASLDEGDSTLGVIMNSLKLDYKLNESITFAHLTRKSFNDTLGRRYRFNDLGVKTAPFFVLVRANMPSILAEVSFISNPVEERRLKSSTYRQKIAESLFDGIRDYIAASQIQS